MRLFQGIAGIAGIVAVALLSGCGGSFKEEVTGNNTGGVIPPSLAQGDVQGMATTHCAKYNSAARITFSRADTGGEVVFVCVDATGNPTWTRDPGPAASG